MGRVWLILLAAATACGTRTELLDDSFGAPSAPEPPVFSSGGTGGTVDEVGAGGRSGVSTGGGPSTGGRRTRPPAAGGAFATGGSGGFTVGGAPPSTGGRSSATGGRNTRPPRPPPPPPPPPPPGNFDGLASYVCFEPCTSRSGCPSARRYAGGCNSVLNACVITCERGCPPETREVDVGTACFCYIDNGRELHTSSECCLHENCGPPLSLPCCDGRVCRNGACVLR